MSCPQTNGVHHETYVLPASQRGARVGKCRQRLHGDGPGASRAGAFIARRQLRRAAGVSLPGYDVRKFGHHSTRRHGGDEDWRTYFLDCPKDYKPGDKVNVVMSLHGYGSYAEWQRNYVPFYDNKDKYKLIVITPGSPVRYWSEADDDYLHNIVDEVVGALGKANVQRFILAGHSQGGLTTSRLVCTDYFKDKVDVRISLSGGRVGDVTPAGKGFAQGGKPVYQQVPGEKQPEPPPLRMPSADAGGPPGRACDYSFIFENGANETIPAATSPLATKYGCSARKEEENVIDPMAGYVWDATRQDPGTDGWGHDPLLRPSAGFRFPELQGWPCGRGRAAASRRATPKGLSPT